MCVCGGVSISLSLSIRQVFYNPQIWVCAKAEIRSETVFKATIFVLDRALPAAFAFESVKSRMHSNSISYIHGAVTIRIAHVPSQAYKCPFSNS